MKYLVSWSGGYDSTYLITKLLAEGHSVKAIYTNIINNKMKSKRELKAISNMTKYFQQFNFNFLQISRSEIFPLSNSNISLHQPLLFLNSLFYACDEDIDRVAIGYIMNDDAISYLNEIKNIWNSFNGLLDDKELPQLEFPLMKYKKQTIVEGFPDVIRKHVTWCESSKNLKYNEYCGKCVPCKKLKNLGLLDVNKKAVK